MHLFFTNNIKRDLAFLPEEEALHCVQVLRHKTGDAVSWVDGSGGRYHGRIVELGKKHCVLHIDQHEHIPRERSWRLQLAVAPTKNMDRIEWLLEKAVEIGVDTFTPVYCERSERRTLRTDRLEKIALSAMKQSLQSWLPQLSTPQPLKDLISAKTGGRESLFIAHCMEDTEKMLLQHTCPPRHDVCILIGPEGDFSDAEVKAALAAGFKPVSLGPHRLRTETAALVALQTVHFLNQ